jgi:uncharacterized protein YyaL (SSP411 family)
MTLALLRLARMRDRQDFQKSAERALESSAGKMRDAGAALPQMLVAEMFALGAPQEIVIAGPDAGALLRVVRAKFLPGAVVMRGEDAPQPMPAIDDRATAYVCENFACQLPVVSARELEGLLKSGH